MDKPILNEQLRNLPYEPGVYLMKDDRDEIIYIGKAKSLVKRVRSYFRKSANPSLKTKIMTEKVASIEVITTDTEVEALMLESNLIKKYQPHFNIILKDDKHFPFLRLTLNENFPRLTKVRRAKKDGSLNFGPFIPESDANRIISLTKKLFKLRRCSGKVKPQKRPCLHYEMGQCSSPCTGKISKDDYAKIVREVRLFLEGKTESLVNEMELKMKEAAAALHFEEAILLRDRIKALKHSLEKQKVISTNLENRDVIAFQNADNIAVIEIFFVRNGRLLSRKSFSFEKTFEVYRDYLRAFLYQFYDEAALIPPEILIPFDTPEKIVLSEILSKKANRKISLLVPKRGKGKALMDMVQKNAEFTLRNLMKKNDSKHNPELMEAVRRYLNMKQIPNQVETYDISNISGLIAVGSQVVWENNEFNRKKFRRYKIKTISGANDVAMMEEVLMRRFKRVKSEKQKLPDIVIIDGGKGQVSRIKSLFKRLGIKSITLIGLAKGRSKKALPRTDRPDILDYVVFSDKRKPPLIPENVLHFLQRQRDEAHRFAIEYHRKLREKINFRSILDEIPGVGAKRKKILLTHFGSLQRISSTPAHELGTVTGIDIKTAKTIESFFETIKDDEKLLNENLQT